MTSMFVYIHMITFISCLRLQTIAVSSLLPLLFAALAPSGGQPSHRIMRERRCFDYACMGSSTR